MGKLQNKCGYLSSPMSQTHLTQVIFLSDKPMPPFHPTSLNNIGYLYIHTKVLYPRLRYCSYPEGRFTTRPKARFYEFANPGFLSVTFTPCSSFETCTSPHVFVGA